MAHKHSDGSPCDCERLKNAEREELREGLKKCTEAREADRRAREEELARRTEAAETEVKGLKKKLIAFQLATAVGVAVVGQEVVSKITAKMDAVADVQKKITGEGGGSSPEAAAPPAPQASNSTIGVPLGRPWIQKQKSDPQTVSGNGDISGVFAGQYVSEPLPSISETSVVSAPRVAEAVLAAALDTPLPVQSIVAAEPFDPYAAFFTPGTLPFDVYSTTLALGTNYGFGEYYGMNTGGAVVPSVPSPSPLAVFAVGSLVHTQGRRRA